MIFLKLPVAVSTRQQIFGGQKTDVAVSECAQRVGRSRIDVTIKSSLEPPEKKRSDLGRKQEESRFREFSTFIRPRKTSLLRAINSAQYRLEKEKEKENAKEVEEDEDDSDLCPVECVREFNSRSEFEDFLGQAKEEGALVVVDFFRTACGSCKYIEKGFTKLCKGAGNSDAQVIFLKHNVMDEYDEQSELAESLRIKVVPLFHFYKDGILVESFPTREKGKILEAICKHTNLTLEDLEQ